MLIVLDAVLIPVGLTVNFLFWYPDPGFVILIDSNTNFLLKDSNWCCPIPWEVKSTVLIPATAPASSLWSETVSSSILRT